MKLLTTEQIYEKYGEPGDASNLGTIILPYNLKLAWEPTVVSKITCHRKIAERLIKVFNGIYIAYGPEKIKELGLDLYGGCYNKRMMRGSNTEWSRHSWGIAIDLDPSRNMLHENHRTARFARPEYKKMIEIFYLHGFLNLGVEKDYDWMHFETSI